MAEPMTSYKLGKELLSGVFYLDCSVEKLAEAIWPLVDVVNEHLRNDVELWFVNGEDPKRKPANVRLRLPISTSQLRELRVRCMERLPSTKSLDIGIQALSSHRSVRIQSTPFSLTLSNHIHQYQESPAQLSFHARLDQYVRKKVDWGTFMSSLVKAAASCTACTYGFIDVAPVEVSHFGLLYDGMAFSSEPHRDMEEFLFRHMGAKRKEFVRHVYWGNFFGPALRARIDPDGELVKEFVRGVDPDFDVEDDETGIDYTQYAMETSDGGVFLALSESPTTCSESFGGVYGFGAATSQAAWLHTKLRERGVLL